MPVCIPQNRSQLLSSASSKRPSIHLSKFTVRTSSAHVMQPSKKQCTESLPAALGSIVGPAGVPISVLTDTYKATHFLQYPNARKMVAYGEFRKGFNSDTTDTRIVSYGIRYIVENYINRQWTLEDVERADLFFSTHHGPSNERLPYPKELFEKFIRENNGYFPVKIQALPEGTCIHARVPLYQITAEGDYSPLCTYLETLLTMVWYPSTVATLSRRARDTIERSFERTADAGRTSPLIPGRLVDFGFRGCTTVEQSIVGGCAHLLNFTSSDTMSAAYYAQFYMNNGRPVASSIPATEHSVMTAWPSERDAIMNMIEKFGSGVYACVMDSYDYAKALSEVLPSVAVEKLARGGYMVLRPDSGDPVEAVIMALKAADKVFGSTTNSKGYKVINKCGVIQGDGITLETLGVISRAVEAAGYSAENVSYGMGGGLLQKVDRDVMSFATKLCYIEKVDGTCQIVMKQPTMDSGKFSLPGVLAVKLVGGIPTVFPADSGLVSPSEDLLQVVYDHGPLDKSIWEDFDTVKQRVNEGWMQLPPSADNLSKELKERINQQLSLRGKAPFFSSCQLV